MGGRHEDEVGIGARERIDPDPVVVHGYRDDRHPEQAGNAPEVVVQAGILDRDPPRATRPERVHDEARRAWANPLQTTTRSASAHVPRTRLR